MIEIETMGTGCILPAFVIGYEVGNIHLEDPNLPLDGEILALGLQTGGYSVGVASVVGAVLRLEANAQFGKGSVPDLVHGIKAMSQDPDYDLLEREYPLLRGFTGTNGKMFSREDLRLLDLYLKRYFNTPALVEGMEALVQFENCDPLDYFAGWNALSAKRRSHVSRDRYYFDEDLKNQLDLNDAATLDAALIRHLRDVGMSVARQGHPRIYLLWENCD